MALRPHLTVSLPLSGRSLRYGTCYARTAPESEGADPMTDTDLETCSYLRAWQGLRQGETVRDQSPARHVDRQCSLRDTAASLHAPRNRLSPRSRAPDR